MTICVVLERLIGWVVASAVIAVVAQKGVFSVAAQEPTTTLTTTTEIAGTIGDDTIDAGQTGINLVYGRAGNDTLRLTNSSASARFYGEAGNDFLRGEEQADRLRGGAGDDRIEGRGGNDALFGDDGKDTILGLGGNDTIYGGEGNDFLRPGTGSDSVDGGAGYDIVRFDSNFADYRIDGTTDGDLTVTGLGSHADDGKDTLVNVERLDFADQRYEVADLDQSSPSLPPEPTSPPTTPTSPPTTPTSPTSPVAGVLHSPSVPVASSASEVVGFKVEGSGWTTFGQAFIAGDVRPGQGLALRIGNASVPVQMDTKALHADGSVRHAVLTVDLPDSTSGLKDAMLVKTAATTGKVITAAGVSANQNYDLDVVFNIEGKTITLDAKSVLGSGKVENWLSGSQVSEFVVSKPLNEYLVAEFNIRAYADGQVRTDVIVRNERTFTPGIRTCVYNVAIRDKGKVVWQRDQVSHYRQANWVKEVWSGTAPTAHLIRDIAYLAESGAVPAYDLSVGITEKAVAASHTKLLAANTDILGNATITKSMPQTGGRDDIGPMPAWAVRWLMSQDARAEQMLFANADAAGSIPWHYRDEATGRPVSIDDHPTMWLDSRQSQTAKGADVLPTPAGTGDVGDWKVDTAHQPAVNYLPYLLTGRHYYLENLQFQAAYDLGWVKPTDRRGDDGILDQGPTRAKGWSLRTVADVAWVTPDNDPLKASFTEKLHNNYAYFIDDLAKASANDVKGYWAITKGGDIAAYQEDYISQMLGWQVQRGDKHATDLLEATGSFTAGRFLNSSNGYDPFYGIAYYMQILDDNGVPYKYWADVWQATFGPGGGLATDNFTWSNPGSGTTYPAHARGSLASLITATGSIDAMEAYGFVVGRSPNMDLAKNPEYASLKPHLPDGSWVAISDHKVGGAGDDSMTGSNRPDLINGMTGNDTINGGQDSDILIGDDGNDRLDGGEGNDFLIGGAGNDTLLGGPGNDTLKGSQGKDTLTGGDGADTFVFRTNIDSTPTTLNTITDFTPKVDRIDLRDIVHSGNRPIKSKLTFIGSKPLSKTPGEIRFAGGKLEADIDGNGIAGFSVYFPNGAEVTAADIIF